MVKVVKKEVQDSITIVNCVWWWKINDIATDNVHYGDEINTNDDDDDDVTAGDGGDGSNGGGRGQ